MKKLPFFETPVITLRVTSTIRFPALFETSLHFVFKERALSLKNRTEPPQLTRHLPTAYKLLGLQIKSSTTERRCIRECVSRSKSNISMACASGRWFITNKDTWPEDGSRYTLIPWGLNPVRLKFFSVSSTGSWSGLLKSNVNSLEYRLSISGSQ